MQHYALHLAVDLDRSEGLHLANNQFEFPGTEAEVEGDCDGCCVHLWTGKPH